MGRGLSGRILEPELFNFILFWYATQAVLMNYFRNSKFYGWISTTWLIAMKWSELFCPPTILCFPLFGACIWIWKAPLVTDADTMQVLVEDHKLFLFKPCLYSRTTQMRNSVQKDRICIRDMVNALTVLLMTAQPSTYCIFLVKDRLCWRLGRQRLNRCTLQRQFGHRFFPIICLYIIYPIS